MAEEVAFTSDRIALMAELSRLSFEAAQIAAPLDDRRFNWQPDGGKGWSVGQCLDHLVRMNRCYCDQIEEAVRAAKASEGKSEPAPIVPGRLGAWFLRELEPPPRRKLPAPKKGQPASRLQKESTLVAFAGEQQRIIELARDTACLDCNSIRFKNPFAFGLRTWTVGTGLLILAAHERRHLWQARNVVAAMPAA